MDRYKGCTSDEINRDLIRRYQAGRDSIRRVREGVGVRPEDVELARDADEAAAHFRERNKGIVIAYARKNRSWSRGYVEREEILADLDVGLMQAMNRFNPSYPNKVSTFLGFQLLGVVMGRRDSLMSCRSPVEMTPVSPDLLDLNPVSHDQHAEHESSVAKMKILADLCRGIPARERDITLTYHGVDVDGNPSLSEVGQAHGISKERVRQIVNRCIDRMRRKANMNRRHYEECLA